MLALWSAAPLAAHDVTPVVRAVVTPVNAERFVVELQFDRDAPVWVFERSALSLDTGERWRSESWSVETPGVAIERIGHHETLVAEDGGAVPRRVRIAFTPYAAMLDTDYPPALILSDGSVALFSGHFHLRPAPSRAVVAALGTALSGLPAFSGGNPEALFTSGGLRLVGSDEDHHGDSGVSLGGSGDYAVYPVSDPMETAHLWALIDPALPGWMRDQLIGEVPQIMALYEERLGKHSGGNPRLIVAWHGMSPDRISLGGSVVGDTIVMQLEGEALTRPSRMAYNQARQFFAHEAAHFWLGNTVTYAAPADAWITEGGADLLAARVTRLIDDGYTNRAALEKALADCADYLARGPLISAPERGDQGAFYACGTIFTLVAERSEQQNGKTVFDFWTRLIATERMGDGEVDVSDWLAALREGGARAETTSAIARLHEVKSGDPARALADLLATVNIRAAIVAGKPIFQ